MVRLRNRESQLCQPDTGVARVAVRSGAAGPGTTGSRYKGNQANANRMPRAPMTLNMDRQPKCSISTVSKGGAMAWPSMLDALITPVGTPRSFGANQPSTACMPAGKKGASPMPRSSRRGTNCPKLLTNAVAACAADQSSSPRPISTRARKRSSSAPTGSCASP